MIQEALNKREEIMRSMEITDEWLYQHMPVVDNAMITALENQVDREYVFSKRFEQKCKK